MGALESLAAWNLISRDRGLAWSIVAATSLKDLAERFGVLDVVAGQLKRYQQDRIIWKEWLTKRAHTVAELLSPTDDYPWETFERPTGRLDPRPHGLHSNRIATTMWPHGTPAASLRGLRLVVTVD